jgi:alanine racemase
MGFRRAQALIHWSHLRENVRALRSLLGDSRYFCPMIKANAYGHGDAELAKFLQHEGVSHLGVGQIEEAERIRSRGVTSPILSFAHFDAAGAEATLALDLTPVMTDLGQVEIFLEALKARAARNFELRPHPVHIKFDTGMNRMGLAASEVPQLVDLWKKNQGALRLTGVLTHLLRGEDANLFEGDSYQQLKKLASVVDNLRSYRVEIKDGSWNQFEVHALNSAALLQMENLSGALNQNFSELQLGARPGLAIYGYSPIHDTKLKLRPVMSIRSNLVSVRKVAAGQTVSYSGVWRASRDSWIGVVPLGYADGYSRLLTGKAQVLVGGSRVSVIGHICMDYFMIDLTELIKSRGLDSVKSLLVTLLGYDEFGNCMSAHEIAEKSGLITWEVLTSVAERIPRVYTAEEVTP